MSSGTINARAAEKEKKQEQESLKAKVKADVAVVLPIIPDDDEINVQIELDYKAITQAINDYVERYTIDSRIDEVDYELSVPLLPDENATQYLKNTLTGTISDLLTTNEVVHVDNDAITDDKVSLTKFELSVEEIVYIDDLEGDSESNPEENNKVEEESQVSITEQGKGNKTVIDKLSKQHNSDLIIQNNEPQLFLQNPSVGQLYWENAPSKCVNKPIPQDPLSKDSADRIVNVGLNAGEKVGSGIENAMDSIERTQNTEMFKYTKVGDNSKLYFKDHARGNGSYKIIGKLADNKAVKKLGMAGKVISYGANFTQVAIDINKASSAEKQWEVGAAAAGKVAAGFVAGSVASWATTAVLVAVSGAAGVAAAPVTLVVIAGCSIVAATVASTAVESHGEDIGGNIGRNIGRNIDEKRNNQQSNTNKAK